MTNTQLEAFLTLCRYGNITQAAEHLFITQPALSRLIKSLESELGYTLFRCSATRFLRNSDRIIEKK